MIRYESFRDSADSAGSSGNGFVAKWACTPGYMLDDGIDPDALPYRSPAAEEAAEEAEIEQPLQTMQQLCAKVAMGLFPPGVPDPLCKADMFSVPDFLLEILDSAELKDVLQQLSTTLRRLSQLDWSVDIRAPPGFPPPRDCSTPFCAWEHGEQDGLSAALGAASDFTRQIAAGLRGVAGAKDTGGSPVDLGLWFSPLTLQSC
eukprot:SAG31_NODE_5404_length_2556_cov_1.703704_3_plen_203_part_00